jgi:hypothetical protein
VQLLDRVTSGLVVAALVAVAASLVLSGDRRLTALRIGLGVALGTVLAGLALMVAQNRLLMSLAGRPISGAAEAALGAALASLGQLLLIVFIVSAIVALVAYLAGRRDWATAFRR